MLWLKSFIECRPRLYLWFLVIVSISASLWFALPDRFHHPGARKPITPEELWHVVVVVFGLVLVPLGAKLLAGSGISSQTSWGMLRGFHPSTHFLLGLPVSRARLVQVRTAVGIGLMVLCAVPSVMLQPVLASYFAVPLSAAKTAGVLPEFLVLGLLAYFIAAFLTSFLDEVYSSMLSLTVWSMLCGYSLAGGPGYPNLLSYASQPRLSQGDARAWLQTFVFLGVCVLLYRATLHIVETKEY
jgi:hypothetical protein